MKTAIVPLLIALASVLAACVPVAGPVTTVYEASASAVLEAVAQFGPQIRPGTDFTPLRVEGRSGSSLILRASETVGSQVVSALAKSGWVTVRVTVTVSPVTRTSSQVTVSALPEGNAAAVRAAEEVLVRLERRFGRVLY